MHLSSFYLTFLYSKESGEKARQIVDSIEHEKFTTSICIAEVYAKALKVEGQDMAEVMREFMRGTSAVIPLNESIAVHAAKIDVSLKKSVGGWGLADSIVLY
ncbi:MAG: hypothetical protein QXU32_08925 [Nitrososphaerales archaeon]